MLSDMQFEQVKQAVMQAGRLLTDREQAAQITPKSRTDFVTAVDLHVQEQLRKELAAIAPAIQLMSEEQSNAAIDRRGAVWILDPVDGTMNLIHNFHHSAISLALAEAGRLTAGLVYDPFADELWWARLGQGAFCNNDPISVTHTTAMADSLVCVGTNPARRDLAERTFHWLRAIYDRCHDIRRLGSAAIALCYVAGGRVDAFAEQGLHAWDFAAAMLIIQEAGGVLTDEQGLTPSPFSSSSIIASNGRVQAELLALVGQK